MLRLHFFAVWLAEVIFLGGWDKAFEAALLPETPSKRDGRLHLLRQHKGFLAGASWRPERKTGKDEAGSPRTTVMLGAFLQQPARSRAEQRGGKRAFKGISLERWL